MPSPSLENNILVFRAKQIGGLCKVLKFCRFLLSLLSSLDLVAFQQLRRRLVQFLLPLYFLQSTGKSIQVAKLWMRQVSPEELFTIHFI